MRMIEVVTPVHIRQFLDLPVKIYQNDPEWIRPLDKDIEHVFDRKTNKTFRHGEVCRWLLENDKGTCIGRVAAFVNRKTADKYDQPTGGIGLFECIDNKEAAHFMFDHCKAWLKERGMEAMDGPINFGERDQWWGLMVEGFYEPVYRMNYNPPYYRSLFESYGFQTYYEQYCFSLDPNAELDPKFNDAHDRLMSEGGYRAEHIRKNDLERFASDFTKIYNKAWAKHGGGKTLSPELALSMFKKMKPVMEEKLVWFVYYENEPIAAWLNLPELNQYFKHMNGKFGIWEKLKFLWLKQTGACRKFYGIVFGVIPEFQGKGVDGLMIWAGAKEIISLKKYDYMELQWIGDFNPKMVAIAKSLGSKKCRTLITYRVIFDSNKQFVRHPILS
ncbi:MAG: hypothetical protein ACKOYC_07920 [Bacteroidota bacterium]